MTEIEILFIGRSNVGKSTLIRELFRINPPVGRRPGVTTKPTNYQQNDLVITDLPGFGFMSGVEGFKRIQDEIIRYVEEHHERVLVGVHVIDANSFIEITKKHDVPVDVEIFDFLLDLNIDTILAINKMDKIQNPEKELNEIVLKLGMLPPYKQWIDRIAPVSAKKSEVYALKKLIVKRLHYAGRDDTIKYLR
ncbi:MAG TPA: GTP-binding protein EngB [Candidatus Acidoferrum sp.]|nr:GTP-binding protein EngB [Candidatus Acidoferrum sp.]